MLDIQEIVVRLWDDLVARPSGPMAFRFLLQPLVATIFAVRDGLRDGRHGRSPYFWTIISDPTQRRQRLREGFAAVGKVMIFAIVLDVVYQFIELGTFYPGEALVVAFILAFVPYLVIRGPVARIARRWYRPGAGSGSVNPR